VRGKRSGNRVAALAAAAVDYDVIASRLFTDRQPLSI